MTRRLGGDEDGHRRACVTRVRVNEPDLTGGEAQLPGRYGGVRQGRLWRRRRRRRLFQPLRMRQSRQKRKGEKKIRVSLCLDQGEKGNRAGAQKKEITGESRGLWFPRLSGLTSSDPNGKKDKRNPLIFLDCGSGGVPIPRKKPRLNGNALEGVGSMRGEKKRYQPTKTQGEAEEMLPPGHMNRKDSGEPWTRSILCSNHGLLNKLPFAIHALSINQNW